MKTLFASLFLLLSSCTVNQDNRIHELLTVQKGAYHRVKDIHVVAESLGNPADSFSLEIEQGSALSTQKGTFPVFVLRGDALALNERFIFAAIDRVTGKIDPQCEFEVLEDDLLAIYDRNGISYEHEIPFIASDGLKAGCPIDYTIVSKRTGTCASAEFIAYPIESIGEIGERIEAIVNHPMGTRFLIRAQGFRPNEPLTLIHRFGASEENTELAADEEGAFSIGLNPTILGRLGGEASLTALRLDGSELRLDYPWGTAIDKKTWKERSVFPMLFVANRTQQEPYPSRLTALVN